MIQANLRHCVTCNPITVMGISSIFRLIYVMMIIYDFSIMTDSALTEKLLL